MAGNMLGCWGMMCKYSKKSIVTKKIEGLFLTLRKKR